MMPEDALSDPTLVAKAELAFLSLPVMSVKLWAAYINKLNAATHLPYYAVVTRMFVKPDKRSQYVVDYEAKFVISDPLVLRAVMARREEAARICLTPFDTYSYDEEPQAPPARKGAAPSKRKF